MSATVMSDPMVVAAAQEAQPPAAAAAAASNYGAGSEVEFAKCECCGLTEECTPAYIERIRQRNQGRWICGLCAEAAKDEIVRSERLISTEEALNRHMTFCRKFKSAGPPANPTVHLIAAMRQLLRRSLDSPRGLRSTPASPVRKGQPKPGPALTRSESCIPTISS